MTLYDRLLSLLALSLIASSACAALPLHLQGRISIDTMSPKGGVYKNQNHGFEVWTNQAQWKVRISYRDEGYYEEIGSDGSKVCAYLFDLAVRDQGIGDEAMVNKILTGSIVDGSVPLNANLFHFTSWFAFCSGTYLDKKNSGDIIPVPWASPRLDPASAAKATFERFSSPPGFPKSAEFFLTADAKKHPATAGWLNGDLKEAEMLLGNYPDDFESGDYKVIETDLLEGTTVPTRIEIRRFAPPPAGEKPFLYEVITLNVDKFDRDSPSSYLPVVPKGFTVSLFDTRLRDMSLNIEGTSYEMKDSAWPTAPSATAVGKLDSMKEQRLLKEESAGYNRKGVLAGLLLVVFVPVAAFMVFRKRL